MGQSIGKWGYSSSPSSISEKDRAILQLKIQRDRLKQYQKKVQNVLDREKHIAKFHLERGNKQLALVCLRKRKFQEDLVTKTEHQLLNLETLTQTIEFSLVEKQIIEGLKLGNEVLKAIHNEMSLENVQKLMDDTQEAIDYQQKISETLGEPFDREHEDVILMELRDLEKLDSLAMLPVSPTDSFPEPSSSTVAAAIQESKKESKKALSKEPMLLSDS